MIGVPSRSGALHHKGPAHNNGVGGGRRVGRVGVGVGVRRKLLPVGMWVMGGKGLPLACPLIRFAGSCVCPLRDLLIAMV